MNRSIFLLFWGVVVLVSSEEFTSGSQFFSGSVYNELIVDNKENILVSPFSAEIILALTQSGAKDATADELRSALHLPDTTEETEATFKTILPTLKNTDYILKTANKIYVEENFSIKNKFKSTATSVYQAQFQNVDFSENVDAAEEINKWVEEETENKIHDLIEANDLDDTTRVVLVNALYFQANWSLPFQTDLTRKTQFFTSAEENVEIVSMYKEAALFNYAESEELDAQILELPFNGKEASMVFVLPNKKEGIAVLEKQAKAVLAKPEFTNEIVEVVLPKFKMESTIDFMDVLEKLGVHKIFNPMEADLSGIAGEKGDLVVTKIVQKTFIDVNEVGVEAAAATVVDGTYSMPPTNKKYFIADHPFMFYIKVHDIILFEGRVLLPEY